MAKRAYEAQMRGSMSHEEGWMLHMQVIFETAGRGNVIAVPGRTSLKSTSGLY